MLHDPNRRHDDGAARRRARYRPPSDIHETTLSELLAFCSRQMDDRHADLFRRDGQAEPAVWWAGDLDLLKRPGVSVIGARDVSPEGLRRAAKIAKALGQAGVVVTSGLAKGVDTAAHTAAIEAGGSTVAVIGTPINKVYPAENSELQEDIYERHLLISQFPSGYRTFPSDFPKRNRLMAAITDASIIVEASDTSGTLHQAKECVRLGRWLFIMRSVVEDERLTWPARFLQEPRVRVLGEASDVLSVLGVGQRDADHLASAGRQ